MKTFALAVTLWMGMHLGLIWPVQAFSVRDITVQSRRGEPFWAEVRLSLEGHEQPGDIDVTIGDQKAYRTEELLRPAMLDRFRVTPVPGKRDTVRITSDVAIDHPRFDLLLLARSRQITIVQHYPVKLAAAPPLKSRASKSAKPLPETPDSAANVKADKDAKTSTYPEIYGPVERGITLFSVVRSLQVPGDKLWLAAVVIWRANKPQFAAGNMHGLPAGAQLRIPPNLDEQMATLKMTESHDVISNQWDEWAALQRMGASKRHMIIAAAAASRMAVALPPPNTAAGSDEQPKDAAPQTVALPVDQKASTVSATELQALLQGLEDRIMKRLTPTVNTAQPGTGGAAVVNAAELHTTLQTFEERLAQRVQHMLAQDGTPVQVATLAAPPTNGAANASGSASVSKAPRQQPPAGLEPQSSTTFPTTVYLLILGNVIWASILGVLSWRWWRRRRFLPHKRA